MASKHVNRKSLKSEKIIMVKSTLDFGDCPDLVSVKEFKMSEWIKFKKEIKCVEDILIMETKRIWYADFKESWTIIDDEELIDAHRKVFGNKTSTYGRFCPFKNFLEAVPGFKENLKRENMENMKKIDYDEASELTIQIEPLTRVLQSKLAWKYDDKIHTTIFKMLGIKNFSSTTLVTLACPEHNMEYITKGEAKKIRLIMDKLEEDPNLYEELKRIIE
jgi:hypothetical protein